MNGAGIAGMLAAYVIGSFPSAYLAGRVLKGVDLRLVGSGNLGATNVYREMGPAAAVTVLVIDMLKGALPTLLLPGMLGPGVRSEAGAAWWALAFGVAAIAGHAKPVFLLWHGGGKGVATAAGVFLALTPGPAAACLLAFVSVVALARFVSVASMTAALLLPILEWFDAGVSPAFWASVAVAVFVLWAHRSNIGRLRAGTEPRFRRYGGDSA